MAAQGLTRAPVTAGERNPVVDLVRVTALGGVVLGHWLKQGWYVDGAGELHRAGLLGIAPWTHPLTWLFQVMPLFFFVGGYANAVSWRHARSRGIDYGAWLAGRVGRLTRPVIPLLAFWVVAGAVAPHVGLGSGWLNVASKSALIPTWFLATYVVIVAIVPLTMAAWERWGMGTLLVGVLAVPIDVVTLQTDSLVVGGLNMIVVWGTLHQLGYAWRDQRIGRRSALLLVVTALTVNVIVVWLGPYGVSMVGVDGHGVNNTGPPRITVLLLGLGMAGLVLFAEPALARWARRPRVWAPVVLVERRVMTIYLWHLTALGILGAVAVWSGGTGLHSYPATSTWWAQRPAWLLALAATTVALVLLVGRAEEPRPVDLPRSRPTLALVEVGMVVFFLGILADRGLAPTSSASRPWLFALTALLVLVLLDRALRRTEPGSRGPAPRPTMGDVRPT